MNAQEITAALEISPDSETRSVDSRLGRAWSERVKSVREQEYLASDRTYEDVLRVTGFTHDEAWAVSDNQSDQIPFSEIETGVQIGDSPIHGKGVFSTRRFTEGEVICPARILDKRTPAGRYCNHAAEPNAMMLLHESGVVALVAVTDIEPRTEIVTDYYTNYMNTRVEAHSPGVMREKILALEAAMFAMPDQQVELKTTHHFAPGVYMRELFIPKGTTLTGKIHKTEHLNILSQGDLSVWTEDGIKRLQASTVITSKPGTKRVGYAHEDSVWITVHPNLDEARDVDLIEERLIAKTFAEVPGFAAHNQIEGDK